MEDMTLVEHTIAKYIENLGLHQAIIKLKSFVDQQVELAKEINMTPKSECWRALSRPALLNFEENARADKAHVAARHAISIRWILLISNNNNISHDPRWLERKFNIASKDVLNCLK